MTWEHVPHPSGHPVTWTKLLGHTASGSGRVHTTHGISQDGGAAGGTPDTQPKGRNRTGELLLPRSSQQFTAPSRTGHHPGLSEAAAQPVATGRPQPGLSRPPGPAPARSRPPLTVSAPEGCGPALGPPMTPRKKFMAAGLGRARRSRSPRGSARRACAATWHRRGRGRGRAPGAARRDRHRECRPGRGRALPS